MTESDDLWECKLLETHVETFDEACNELLLLGWTLMGPAIYTGDGDARARGERYFAATFMRRRRS